MTKSQAVWLKDTLLIRGRRKRHSSSPKFTDQLWSPPNLQFNTYQSSFPSCIVAWPYFHLLPWFMNVTATPLPHMSSWCAKDYYNLLYEAVWDDQTKASEWRWHTRVYHIHWTLYYALLLNVIWDLSCFCSVSKKCNHNQPTINIQLRNSFCFLCQWQQQVVDRNTYRAHWLSFNSCETHSPQTFHTLTSDSHLLLGFHT